MNDPNFTLLVRKNYCNLFNCWTDELDAQGKVVARIGSTGESTAAAAGVRPGGSGAPQLDDNNRARAALEKLAPAAAIVTKAASTLKNMLDPSTTSIVLKAQNDLDQELAQEQLKTLKASHSGALQTHRPARPVSLLAKHLVSMEKTVLSQEQQLLRDEQGLPYETRVSAAPASLPRTLRDATREATGPSGLPKTLRDATEGAGSSLRQAAKSADAVIQRQSALAANSDINGEDDAKQATDAVEDAVTEATREADASEAEATQEAAANEAAAVASSTAKGISDEVMGAARREAADAQEAAEGAAKEAEASSAQAEEPEMGSDSSGAVSALRHVEKRAVAQTERAMAHVGSQVAADRKRQFVLEEEERGGMVARAVDGEAAWEAANGLRVSSATRAPQQAAHPAHAAQSLEWDPHCPCRGGCPCPAHGHGSNAVEEEEQRVKEAMKAEGDMAEESR